MSDRLPVDVRERAARWVRVVERDGAKKTPMSLLWDRLDAMYPRTWAMHFGADAVRVAAWTATWSEAFAEESLTPEEVANGLRRLRSGADASDWPPSLTEFLKACRPPLDPEAAFVVACEQMSLRLRGGEDRWPSPAVYWAANRMGSDLLSCGYGALSRRWVAALREAEDDVRAGRKPNGVPAFAPALPAPGQTEVSPEKARENLARIAEMMRGLAKPMQPEA